MYEHDPRAFAPRYLAFLRAGYSDAPAVLIRRHFGFGFDPRSLLDDAITLLEDRLRDYEGR
jgi:oligoendopeptidase F